MHSYHDVEVESDKLPRIKLFNASYGLQLICTRAAGWELWNMWSGVEELLAVEYHEVKLRIYVSGIQIL